MGKRRTWDPSSSEGELETKPDPLSVVLQNQMCLPKSKDSSHVRVWWAVRDTGLSAGAPWVDAGTGGLFPGQKWERVVSSPTRIAKADFPLLRQRENAQITLQ